MKGLFSRLEPGSRFPADLGQESIAIPDLPEDAADEEIMAALAAVEAAKAELFARRKALAEEAGALFSPDPAIPEEEVDARSRRIMESLKEAKKSITGSTGVGEL